LPLRAAWRIRRRSQRYGIIAFTSSQVLEARREVPDAEKALSIHGAAPRQFETHAVQAAGEVARKAAPHCADTLRVDGKDVTLSRSRSVQAFGNDGWLRRVTVPFGTRRWNAIRRWSLGLSARPGDRTSRDAPTTCNRYFEQMTRVTRLLTNGRTFASGMIAA
jgi:hypothetical protein